MSDCTPEFWTLKDIQTSLEKEYNGKKKIVIPMFQRGKRWDKNKKETFIDSLRKKYPIGTLLFYKTNEGNQEIYTLIDGLQRGTAIKEYLANPSKFFTIKDFANETMDKVYNLIREEKEESDNLFEKNIDYRGWIKIDNTNINYPILQGQDNEEYLYKDINNEYIVSGSIFMNYLNNGFDDQNTVLFGHNMKNGTMFANLKKYKEEDFFYNNNYIEIELSNGQYLKYRLCFK